MNIQRRISLEPLPHRCAEPEDIRSDDFCASPQAESIQSGPTINLFAIEPWHFEPKTSNGETWYGAQLNQWRRDQFEETVVVAVIGLSSFAGIVSAFISAL